MGSDGWVEGGWVLVGLRQNPGRSTKPGQCLSHWFLLFSFFCCDLMVDLVVVVLVLDQRSLCGL